MKKQMTKKPTNKLTPPKSFRLVFVNQTQNNKAFLPPNLIPLPPKNKNPLKANTNGRKEKEEEEAKT